MSLLFQNSELNWRKQRKHYTIQVWPKYTVFMDWKNKYSENEHTTWSNLQIQCNPYQATNGIFHRNRTNNFTVCKERPKKPRQLKRSWERRMELKGINLPAFRLYYKATVIKTVWYWHKDKNISMEQNRKPRDKSTHLWTPYLWQRRQEYTMEKRQSL